MLGCEIIFMFDCGSFKQGFLDMFDAATFDSIIYSEHNEPMGMSHGGIGFERGGYQFQVFPKSSSIQQV